MEQQLNQVFAGLGWRPVHSIQKMHGDASYRTYFRVHRTDGASCVIMELPAGKASASEEITNFQGELTEPSFVQIDRALAEAGLPVPKVFHYSAPDRWIVLEDCGDVLFADRVRDTDAPTRAHWYRQAIDLLAALQAKSRRIPRDGCIALQRSFDETLLNWEFDHFLEYALEARGHHLSAGEKSCFLHHTRAMTEQMRKRPFLFTHRDFQSRNLIVRDDQLILLDFQDALLGPYVYDLVSLLRDSYVALSQDELEVFTGYFADCVSRDADIVRRDFDLVTVQRKMKDAGRFVYIDRVKGNPQFLSYLPASLAYVREALRRLPDHGALVAMLTPHIPEWS